MRVFRLVILAALSFSTLPAFSAPGHIAEETEAQREARMKWFVSDRFGMFIHWGLYSVPARGAWTKTNEKLTDERYDTYFPEFDPDLYDAREWARMARNAGMKYVVMTAKHHEGFCMWDSKVTDYKVTNTPAGRDLLREYVDAFRAEGLRVGFYYSLIDWHHPSFTVDKLHPLRPADEDNPAAYEALNKGRDMSVYRKYMKDQVRELLTEYGQIDVIWFDYSYTYLNPGKGRKDWDSEGLVKLARELQPQILINNRADLKEFSWGWDFQTPEQYRVRNAPTFNGRKAYWETCQTMNGEWGYNPTPGSATPSGANASRYGWKTASQLLEILAETVSKGGNLLLNVGPTARGEIDRPSQERLAQIADWMRYNSRSIYGCTEAPAGITAPDRCILTYNPETKRLYIHLVDYPTGRLNIDFGDRVKFARFLHDGSEVRVESKVRGTGKDAETVVSLLLPMIQPDVVNPVIEVALTDGPAASREKESAAAAID